MKRQVRLRAQPDRIYVQRPPHREQSAESVARRARALSTRPRRMRRQRSRCPWSERLVQQRGNGGPISVADRTAGFMLAVERNQRRLHAGTEGFHRVLLAVEINDEVDEVLTWDRPSAGSELVSARRR